MEKKYTIRARSVTVKNVGVLWQIYNFYFVEKIGNLSLPKTEIVFRSCGFCYLLS